MSLAERLASSTLELFDITSVSREEEAILAWTRERMGAASGLRPMDDEDGALWYLPTERQADAGDPAIGPKQAWTPVAEFGLAGIDAVNFGPRDPRYAHTDEERIDVDSLVRCHGVLRAFLEHRTAD